MPFLCVTIQQKFTFRKPKKKKRHIWKKTSCTLPIYNAQVLWPWLWGGDGEYSDPGGNRIKLEEALLSFLGIWVALQVSLPDL